MAVGSHTYWSIVRSLAVAAAGTAFLTVLLADAEAAVAHQNRRPPQWCSVHDSRKVSEYPIPELFRKHDGGERRGNHKDQDQRARTIAIGESQH